MDGIAAAAAYTMTGCKLSFLWGHIVFFMISTPIYKHDSPAVITVLSRAFLTIHYFIPVGASGHGDYAFAGVNFFVHQHSPFPEAPLVE